MNPEIKAQWVAALRSGDYQQGKGALHQYSTGNPDLFCCLGVLCHLAAEAGVVQSHLTGRGEVQYDHAALILPPSVSEWAGLGGNLSPQVPLNGDMISLANLNDAGVSFETIANRIEEHL
jgi:hypothetical protein